MIRKSVIICSGNFKRATQISHSIVLCCGSFDTVTGIDNSVVQAASFGRCNGTRENVYINLPEVEATTRQGDRYIMTTVDPLSLLRLTQRKKEQ